jgi:hypothetical protein
MAEYRFVPPSYRTQDGMDDSYDFPDPLSLSIDIRPSFTDNFVVDPSVFKSDDPTLYITIESHSSIINPMKAILFPRTSNISVNKHNRGGFGCGSYGFTSDACGLRKDQAQVVEELLQIKKEHKPGTNLYIQDAEGNIYYNRENDLFNPRDKIDITKVCNDHENILALIIKYYNLKPPIERISPSGAYIEQPAVFNITYRGVTFEVNSDDFRRSGSRKDGVARFITSFFRTFGIHMLPPRNGSMIEMVLEDCFRDQEFKTNLLYVIIHFFKHSFKDHFLNVEITDIGCNNIWSITDRSGFLNGQDVITAEDLLDRHFSSWSFGGKKTKRKKTKRKSRKI